MIKLTVTAKEKMYHFALKQTQGFRIIICQSFLKSTKYTIEHLLYTSYYFRQSNSHWGLGGGI